MTRLGLLLIICCTFEVHAKTKARVSAEMGLNSAWMHFAEFDGQNKRLLTESGWLPGLRGAINWSYLGLELSGSVEMFQGQVGYDGQAKDVQTQTVQPHKTSTDTLLVNVGTQLLLSMDIERHWWLLTSINRGAWNRQIQAKNGVTGLNEYYRWWQLAGGVQYRLYPHAYIQASGLWMTNAHLDVNSSVGSGRIELPKGSGLSLRFSVPLGKQDPWIVQGAYSFEQFPRSKTEIIGTKTFAEPKNQRQLFSLGLSKAF